MPVPEEGHDTPEVSQCAHPQVESLFLESLCETIEFRVRAFAARFHTRSLPERLPGAGKAPGLRNDGVRKVIIRDGRLAYRRGLAKPLDNDAALCYVQLRLKSGRGGRAMIVRVCPSSPRTPARNHLPANLPILDCGLFIVPIRPGLAVSRAWQTQPENQSWKVPHFQWLTNSGYRPNADSKKYPFSTADRRSDNAGEGNTCLQGSFVT